MVLEAGQEKRLRKAQMKEVEMDSQRVLSSERKADQKSSTELN